MASCTVARSIRCHIVNSIRQSTLHLNKRCPTIVRPTSASACNVWQNKKQHYSVGPGSKARQPVIQEVNGETIIRSPYPDVELPEMNFTEFVFSELDSHQQEKLVVDNVTGKSFSSRDLKELSIKIASGLTKLGFKRGERMLIFSHNCPEYAMMFLACGATGIVLSTANPIFTPMELARQLKHSGSVAIVTMPSMLPTVLAAIQSEETLSKQIRVIFSVGKADGCVPLSLLMEDDGKAFPDLDFRPRDDVLTLPYSSGTTGLPKGVELTHYNVVSNIMQTTRAQMSLDPNEECLMGFLPFYHIYGMVVVQFCALCLGTKLIVMPKFEGESFLKAVQEHKVTYIHMVPPTALFLAKSPLVEQYDISSLRTLVTAAAPFGDSLTKELKARLKHAHIIQAYGLTESSPLTHYDEIPGKPGSIGRLIPNTVAKVVDPITKECLKLGETGEFVIKGPQVMKGYLDNPKATEDTVKEGWLFTGDIGNVDKDGYFVVSDRLKELIKYKGYQIAPAELEAVIVAHPSVKDVAVIGVDAASAEGHGEVPRAYVVPNEGVKVTEDEILKFVQENVAPYKWLRGGVQFIEEVPKTASGKILRRNLKELVKQQQQ